MFLGLHETKLMFSYDINFKVYIQDKLNVST